jgi:hypothetical protein
MWPTMRAQSCSKLSGLWAGVWRAVQTSRESKTSSFRFQPTETRTVLSGWRSKSPSDATVHSGRRDLSRARAFSDTSAGCPVRGTAYAYAAEARTRSATPASISAW